MSGFTMHYLALRPLPCDSCHDLVCKFTAIVGLQDLWSTENAEYLDQLLSNILGTFLLESAEINEFGEVVLIVQDKFKFAVRFGLHVNQINLTSVVKVN